MKIKIKTRYDVYHPGLNKEYETTLDQHLAANWITEEKMREMDEALHIHDKFTVHNPYGNYEIQRMQESV